MWQAVRQATVVQPLLLLWVMNGQKATFTKSLLHPVEQTLISVTGSYIRYQ